MQYREWEGAEGTKWTGAKKKKFLSDAADPKLGLGRSQALGPSAVATLWNSIWVACYMSAIKTPGAINEEKKNI